MLYTLERTLGDLAWRLPSKGARLEAAADDRHAWVLYDACGAGTVALWDVDTGREVEGTSFETRLFSCAAVSRDGRTLALAHEDNTVTVWDAYARATIRTIERARAPWLVLDERGTRLLVGDEGDGLGERNVSLYDVSVGERQVRSAIHLHATLSLDAKTLVTDGAFTPRLQSWDLTNEEPRELYAVRTHGWALQYAPVSDGDVFVGTSEGEVCRWSPRDGVTR